MLTKMSFLKSVLVCTVFSTSLSAADHDEPIGAFLTGQSPVLNQTVPTQGIISEFSTCFGNDVFTKTKDKINYYGTLGSKIWKERDFGPLVIDLLESSLTAANQKLISDCFKSTHGLSGEFDVEALRPLVETVRIKLCHMIEYVCLKKSLYGYMPGVGRIQIYEDKSVFRLLLETFIPDIVPSKALMIKIADIGPIRNYLMYKFDEMIIEGILSLYQKTTGKTVKNSVQDLVSQLTKKPVQDSLDVSSSSKPKTSSVSGGVKAQEPVNSDVKEEEKKVEEKKETTLPQGNSSGEESVSTQPSLPTINPSSSTPEFPITGPLTELATASGVQETEVGDEKNHVWEYIQPRLNYFLRAALCDLMKPGLEKVVQELGQYGQKQIIPSSSTLKQYVASGFAGFYSFGLLGVPVGMGTYYLGNTACESFLKVLKKRMVDHIDLFTKFHSYSFLPYTPAEHYLYHMNSAPTSGERLILADEYETQEMYRQEGIIRALLRDLAKRPWIGRFISVSEMDKVRDESGHGAKKKNNLSAQLALGEIAYKKKHGEKLTSEQEELLNNLLNFPSYSTKEKELELIKLWGEKQKNILEKAKTLRDKQKVAETHLIDVYQLYGHQIPSAFAMAYQHLGSWSSGADWGMYEVDFIDVEEAVAESLKNQISTFSEHDLALLKEAANDWKFLISYIEKFVKGHEKSQQKECSYKDAQEVLKDPQFLMDLPNAYILVKEERYIQENIQVLKHLKHSPLCFGLSFADVVELHKHMTPGQIKSYGAEVVVPYNTLLHAAAESLVSTDGSSSLDPYVNAVKDELITIHDTLERLQTDNKRSIIKHYAGQFIQGADFNAFIREELQNLPGDMEEKAKSIDLSQEKYKLIKAKYATVSEDALKHFIAQADFLSQKGLTEKKWKVFAEFRDTLSKFVVNGAVRTLIYQEISNAFLDVLVSSSASDTDSELKMTDFVEILPVSEHSLETETYKPIKIVPFANYGVYERSDFTGFYVSEIVNGLINQGNVLDIASQSVENLVMIHRQIQARKKHTIDLEALEFADAYLSDILRVKSELPEYKNRLFYGYPEIVDLILNKNKETIAEILKQ